MLILNTHFIVNLVRRGGLEPPHLAASGPKPGASTNFATFANSQYDYNTEWNTKTKDPRKPGY